MEEFKGTKGEWFIEESDLTIRSKSWGKSNLMGDFKGNIIADMMKSLGGRSREHAFDEVKYNAKLISTSPELLRCLQEIYYAYERGKEVNDGYATLTMRLIEAIKSSSIAIQKALK